VVGRKITGKRTAPSEELLSSATMQQRVVDTFKSTPSTANTTTATTSAPTVSASPLGSSSLQTHNISSTATSSISIATWKKNLERRGGFWGNAYWYDAQLLRRLPLAKPMLEEMIAALPPCDGKRVLDLCSGSGRAACALLKAYPTAKVTLFDSSDERLAIARKRFAENDMLTNARFYSAIVNCTMFQLAESPYDLILGALALHVIVEQPQHYYQNDQSNHLSAQEPALLLSVEERYEKLFEILYNSLRPGGHLIFGDHVGQLPLYQQLKLMEKVGFTDVDCAWRQNDFFAAGGMKPNATNSQDLSAL
jgi:SAM-dependent methyltransferase